MVKNKEIIKSIKHDEEEIKKGYVGYVVETTNQKIYLLIENVSLCCENWGIFISTQNKTDYTKFIGSKFISVNWDSNFPYGNTKISSLDYDLVPDKVDKFNTKNEDGTDVSKISNCNKAVISIKTDKGEFKIVAYNDQNGYYSHEVIASWKDYYDKQQV